MAFIFQEKQRYGRTNGQTDRRMGATLNAAPPEGRIIIYSIGDYIRRWSVLRRP